MSREVCGFSPRRGINIALYRCRSSSAHPDSNYAVSLTLFMFIYPVIKITLSVAPNYVARGTSSTAEENSRNRAVRKELLGSARRREERRGNETRQRKQNPKESRNDREDRLVASRDVMISLSLSLPRVVATEHELISEYVYNHVASTRAPA